jgi:Lrp/AsnC family leucine-responsive transcriptional regulator
MIAFIQIKLNSPAQLAETGKYLSAIEQIQEVHYLAGEDCLVIKLRVANNTELEMILRTKVASLDAVKDAKTLIALSTYKESAKILLPETLE